MSFLDTVVARASIIRHSLSGGLSFIAKLEDQTSDLKMLAAQVLIETHRSMSKPRSIREREFKVFSQFGDDGIIQYLISALAPLPEIFIEFGVQDYRESNTRFLLQHDNWKGLVLEASAREVAAIRRQSVYWRHDLTAVRAFVTRDNVNDLFSANGFSGQIGLLHIDIDGNDYWVWEAVRVVDPVIVIVEYNSVFGPDRALTIPYDPAFARGRAHYSHLYWGCSLTALARLAQTKGYRFIGCNSAGNNAYFVREERAAPLPSPTAQDGFVASKFRESRSRNGYLNFLGGADRVREIGEMQVFDLERQALIKLNELSK